MNDELCNPALWSTNPTTNNTTTNTAAPNGSSLSNGAVLGNGDSSSDGGHHLEMGGIGGSGNGALDEARLRYKNSVAALRTVLTAIPNSQKAKAFETGSTATSPADEADIESWKKKPRISGRSLQTRMYTKASNRSTTGAYYGCIDLAKSLFHVKFGR
ncbi:hypothetical protein ERO13_1Z049409v2 [Gossypium hirsutum]|nr:hypothetical protein ERO13_1Z049409v2 [Gossypium hirsutum]